MIELQKVPLKFRAKKMQKIRKERKAARMFPADTTTDEEGKKISIVHVESHPELEK